MYASDYGVGIAHGTGGVVNGGLQPTILGGGGGVGVGAPGGGVFQLIGFPPLSSGGVTPHDAFACIETPVDP